MTTLRRHAALCLAFLACAWLLAPALPDLSGAVAADGLRPAAAPHVAPAPRPQAPPPIALPAPRPVLPAPVSHAPDEAPADVARALLVAARPRLSRAPPAVCV